LQSHTAYRFAVGLALTAAFLIVWMNVAAGLIGIEDDDPANLLYVGVLALHGAFVALFAGAAVLFRYAARKGAIS
jgi:hypothetical protein